MTDEQRATWARSLSGTLDANGYLVLHADAPLSIDNAFDGLFGAPTTGADQLEIASHLYCGQAGADTAQHRRFVQGDGTLGVAWCVGDDLHISATGTKSFVDLVDRSLEASALEPAPNATVGTTTTTMVPPNPTTSTAPPVATPFKAFSASFVSPQHGWVLDTNGTLAETTDGGRSWRDVGVIGGFDGGRIRFADAMHGFAFNEGQMFTTTDGGRSWSATPTPFTGADDLAASGGEVYAVAFDDTTTS